MCDVSSDVRDAKNIFSGSLIVGDHDTITLFGIDPQNRMKSYSRRVVELLLKGTGEFDRAISDVLNEIEHFEVKAKKLTKSFWKTQLQYKEIQKEYTKILSYIDKMTVYFKLQQAQLMKETKLLEKMSETVASCAAELEKCVETGKAMLLERNCLTEKTRMVSLFSETTADLDIWYERLEKRIDGLLVTHAVSLQSKAQIKMLRDNNLLILDRISSIISNIFPIWQNQMAIMLGIDLMKSRMNVQDKLISVSDRYVKKTTVKFQRIKPNEIQMNKLLDLNKSLINALEEMTCLETDNNNLRDEFLNIAKQTERG